MSENEVSTDENGQLVLPSLLYGGHLYLKAQELVAGIRKLALMEDGVARDTLATLANTLERYKQ